MARKQKIERLSEDKIRSCVALGRQVAPQETARRRIMAEALKALAA